MVSGADNEAVKRPNESHNLMKKAGMELNKLITNWKFQTIGKFKHTTSKTVP